MVVVVVVVVISSMISQLFPQSFTGVMALLLNIIVHIIKFNYLSTTLDICTWGSFLLLCVPGMLSCDFEFAKANRNNCDNCNQTHTKKYGYQTCPVCR